MGFVLTHRKGNTGIGKTLEDLLGITENNIPGPNSAMIELKSARKNAKSMLTLFTKSPSPERINLYLLERFGYPSRRGNKKKELHTTVNALDFNQLKEQLGFKLETDKDRINLIIPSKEVVCYWDKETLRSSFERKLPKVMYVKAEVNGRGNSEEFWYNEAWLLSGFDYFAFIKLLNEGVLLVDIRIGQYPDGTTHDHGTGFRVFPARLDLCFEHRERII